MSRESTVGGSEWVWSTRKAAQLGALTLARFCANLALRIVYPFAPAFARGLGVPVATIYLLISIRNATGLLSPLFASLPERAGRRNVMTGATVLLAAIALLVAGVPAVWAFAVFLIGTGFIKVTYDPSMQSYIGDTVPYTQRGRALAVTELAWSGAYLIGAPITGWLIASSGWQAPFLWLGLASLAAAVLLWRVLRSLGHRSAHAPGIGYVWQVLRENPTVLAAGAFMMLAMVAQETLFIVYGDWMEGTFQLSLTSLGLATTLIGVAEAGGEATAGWSVDRFGKRPVIIAGGLINAVMYLLIPLSGGSLTAALVVLVILFFTFEITVVGAIPLLTELVPTSRAAVMSLSLGAMAAGRTIGSLVGPVVWQQAGVLGNSLLAAALMLVAVFVLFRWVHEYREVT